jgi:hypothetical protein
MRIVVKSSFCFSYTQNLDVKGVTGGFPGFCGPFEVERSWIAGVTACTKLYGLIVRQGAGILCKAKTVFYGN